MSQKTLVAYASKYGATREIAECVASRLRQSGLEVDLIPVEAVRGLDAYQAVILGAALYVGKWPKPAETFLKTQEAALAKRPLWIFSSGPTGEGQALALLEGEGLPTGLKPLIARIQPRDVTVFHGFINPDRINFIEKWAVQKIVKKPLGDFRDWDSIASWAGSIASALSTAETL